MRKSRNYWSIREHVFEEARKYGSRVEFEKGNRSACNVARKNGWLDEMPWLVRQRNPKGYWNRERVFAEARKYGSRKEFEDGCHSAYNIALRNHWLDEMPWLVNKDLYSVKGARGVVYAYIFENYNTAYVGWTVCKKDRDIQHRKKGPVYNFARLKGIEIPTPIVCADSLTLPQHTVENIYIDFFRDKLGYTMLNKHKGWSVGTIRAGKWTKDNVIEESRKYGSKTEFQKGCSGAYQAARKNGWLDDMPWLVAKRKPSDFWNNRERVIEESRKYGSRFEFEKGSRSAYNIALKNNWLDEMPWLVQQRKPSGYWDNRERVFEASKQYSSRKKFEKGSRSAYNMARKNGWLDEMPWLKPQKRHIKSDG